MPRQAQVNKLGKQGQSQPEHIALRLRIAYLHERTFIAGSFKY